MDTYLFVTLEDVYQGAVKNYSFTRKEVCRTCKGTGDKTAKLVKCPQCGGSGMVVSQVNMGGMVFNTQQHCPRCHGRGKSGAADCPHCRGRKIVNNKKILQVNIEKGVREGELVLFKGQADQQLHKIPGDVTIKIRLRNHPRFTRKGDDLLTDLTINLKEAIMGFKKTLPHLDGHEVIVTNDDITQHGQVIRVPGEGMPMTNDPGEFGDLLVRMKVVFPSRYSEAELALIRSIYE